MSGKKEINRRDFVKITAGGVGTLAGMGLAGGFFRQAWAGSGVKRGGLWRVAKKMTVPTLDAHKNNEYFASIAGMYDCLFDTKIDPKTKTLHLAPMLAEKWHPEEKGSFLVVELRKGVRFHDNSKFNANVAKWNLDRMASHPASNLKSLLRGIKKVEIIDDYTIGLRLKAPNASIPYFLSTGKQWGGFISKAFVEKHGEDELSRKGCGSGPFRYKNWIVDEKIIVERYPDYWRKGADGKPLPYLDTVEEIYKPQLELAVIDLRSGNLETIWNPEARDVAMIIKNPNLEYVKLPPHEAAIPCIGFNQRRGPFAKLEVRQAACYALDREKFAKIMGFGIGRVHQYPRIAVGQPGWGPKEWPDYSYNPAKAKEMLKAAGYDKTPVGIYCIAREPDTTLGEMIKANWDAVGLKTELKAIERLPWIETMRKTDKYDAAFWKGNISMGAFMLNYFTTGASGNWVKYSNSEVDKLLKEATQAYDIEKRAKLNNQALKIIYGSAAFTSCYALSSAVAQQKYVKGLRQSYQNIMPHEIWLDK